eukprot:364637-Chlamydomonas_euryale.AAC.12
MRRDPSCRPAVTGCGRCARRLPHVYSIPYQDTKVRTRPGACVAQDQGLPPAAPRWRIQPRAPRTRSAAVHWWYQQHPPA